MHELTLAEAIESLRAVLERLNASLPRQGVAFRTTGAEVTLQVAWEQKSTVDGGLNWVAHLRAGGSSSDQQSHQVKLFLQPVDAADRAKEIFVDGEDG